jgi:hypothetical protein
VTTDTGSITGAGAGLQTSWFPMIVIGMAQVLMSFNINALRVSIGGIVATFDASDYRGDGNCHPLALYRRVRLVSQLYDRLSLRHIARLAFMVVAAGLALLAIVIATNGTPLW